MFITIINDCRDQNASGRQQTRVASLFSLNPTFIGVRNEYEAAGNLVDTLDAAEGREGMILVNVAPRDKGAKRWDNGSPFGIFTYKKTTVIGTIDGYTFSLAKKLDVIKALYVFDIKKAAQAAVSAGLLTQEMVEYLAWTQFRSFDFVPRLAHWLHKGVALPREPLGLEEIHTASGVVWDIDCFGNIKTSLLPHEAAFEQNAEKNINGRKMRCVTHLRDVPDAESAFIIGSSGIDVNRFCEIVIQGASAAREFNFDLGERLTVSPFIDES